MQWTISFGHHLGSMGGVRGWGGRWGERGEKDSPQIPLLEGQIELVPHCDFIVISEWAYIQLSQHGELNPHKAETAG